MIDFRKQRGCLTLVLLLINLHGTGANTTPSCTTTTHNINLSETTATGTIVVTLTPDCSDVDAGADGTLTFSITSGNDDGLFSLTTAGVLSVFLPLDYDGFTRSYSLIIAVDDGGTPSLGISITANVFVDSANDNDPGFFSGPYTVAVDEDIALGALVAQANPFDFDLILSFDFQPTYCAITAGADSSKFSIDITTGTITLQEALDYETATQHVIEITIVDLDILPQKTASSTVTIDVNNINDNTPNTPQSLYAVSVPETTSVGATLQDLACTDVEDTNLVYNIVTGDTSKFEVVNGLVKTKATIDMDTEASTWDLVITCRDRDVVLRLTATVTVQVFVTGVDDNVPVWATPESGTYTPSVDENSSAGTVVTTISATDADQAGTADSTITYGIDTATTMFGIDSATGQVTVTGDLDRETTATYSLAISAYSSTLTASKITGTLTVTVNDLNDNDPSFTTFLYTPAAPIPEDTALNTPILTVTANDADANANGLVTYSISSGNTATGCVMSIAAATGEITNTASLDYESATSCTLVILATDGGGPARISTATAIITISPINEATPDFGADFTASVMESVVLGTSVTDAVATDTDTGNDGVIEYSLFTFGTVFNIDVSSGRMSVAVVLDREITATYSVVVRGIDQSDTTKKTGSVTITVNVGDANDNDPVFTTLLYTPAAPIPEDTALNTPILTVTANDADANANGLVTYSISSGNTATGCVMSIAAATGEITNTASLDYESATSCTLVILATDGGGPARISTATAIITISPINEATPDFGADFTASVMESVVLGTSVTDAIATDTDTGNDGVIVYSINSVGPFNIDSNGAISVASVLDRETTASYTVEVYGVDQSDTTKKTGSVTITMTVDDANDNEPTCTDTVVYKPLGLPTVAVNDIVHSLTCSDLDAGINQALTYTIASGNTNSDFAVSAVGVVTVANLPSQTSYTLEVTVADQGATPLSTTMHIEVTVYLPPTFAALPTTESYIESSAIGALIHTVVANVASGSKSFSIVSGNAAGKFQINSLSGKVYLYASLDRETTPSYGLDIRVTDTVSSLTTDATLTVAVTDFNDIVPSFTNSFYTLAVVENVVGGTLVQDLAATDTDLLVNAALTYAILTGNTEGKFSINTAGLLSLANTLDAETTLTYILVVTATDSGATPLTGTTTVYIAVTNVDEFTPAFLTTGNAYTHTLAEDTALGTTVFTVTAQDQDVNTVISYAITAGNAGANFVIDSITGDIVLSVFLDRETTATYSLTITADNGAGSTVDASLDITVTDVNDNDPAFTPTNVYGFSVDEDQGTGITVGSVAASDLDTGLNANLILTIVGGNTGPAFQLVSLDIILIAALDFETTPNYILLIEAKDQGTPARSSTATVNIAVNPIYAQPQYPATTDSISIAENTGLSTLIYNADATVSGAVEGAAGDLHYIIQSGNADGKFSVSLYTGEINVVGALDRETTASYIIVIRAENKNDGTLRDSVSVTITLTDINDNDPVFNPVSYSLSIDEGLGVPSTPGTVTATDDDDGVNSAITFSIVAGVGSSDFTIDGTTGVISTAVVLSAATQASYLLIVAAVDSGTTPRSGSTTVVITVNDVNDQRPAFGTPTNNYPISESVGIGETVYQFYAADGDTGPNGVVGYNIISGNAALKFTLQSTNGQLVMANTLDRESQSTYVLVVEATDSGATPKTGTTTLSVTVVDANDNSPIFATNPYTAIVSRTATISTAVSTVVATDADVGTNSDLQYSIVSGNTDFLFLVDSAGLVSTVGILTAAADTYTLVIQAEDRGVPYLSASTTLSVTVDPILTPAPSNFIFTISENAATNSPVGTVTIDPVHATGATVDFTFVSGNQDAKFQIGGTNGQITTISLLDYSTKTDYYLVVNLKDRLNPLLDYNKNVHIQVTDYNNFTPVFNPTTYSTQLVENTPVGMTVLVVTATDDDTGINAQMTFEISAAFPLATTYLQIDNSGVITVNQVPDYESVTVIVCDVVVKDGGTPQNTATAGVTVNIVDVFDTATPAGSPSNFFSRECPTDATNSEVIVTLTALDFGLTVGATDTLSFLTLSSGGVFSIGTSSGDFYIQDHNYLYSDSRYFMDVIAQVTTAANVMTASSGLVRVDAFNPNTVMVVLTHSVDVTTVSAQVTALKAALQVLFPVTKRVEIWKVRDTSTTARRRLLATGSESLVYVVSDTSADTLDGLDTSKSFDSQSQVLGVLQQTDGSPVTALGSATFATFPVTGVTGYTSSSSSSSANWAQTTVGIAVLSTIGGSLVLLAAILATYFLCTRTRKYRMNGEKQQEKAFSNTQAASKGDRRPLVAQYGSNESVFGKQPITGKTVEVESSPPPHTHMMNGAASSQVSSQKLPRKSKQDVSVSMMDAQSYDNVPGPLFHSGGKKAIYKEQADLRSEAGSRSDGTVTPRSILIQSPI